MSQRYFEGARHAALYAKFRPSPPRELTDVIVDYLKQKYNGELSLCLDVGCGNGQCTTLLATYFQQVLATDISPAQIDAAKELNHPANITFQTCPAEQSPAETGSVQLVNACVAAHWFDLPEFFKETDRLLCPYGVVALSSYFKPILCHPTRAAELNQLLDQLCNETLASYWGAGIKHLKTEYADFVLPFEDVQRRTIWTAEATCTLFDFVSSLTTWSGYQNYCKANGDSAGQDILKQFSDKMRKVLGTAEEPDTVKLAYVDKYFLVLGRKTGP